MQYSIRYRVYTSTLCRNNLFTSISPFSSFALARWIRQSVCCDDLECKNPQHQNLPPGVCRRSLIMTNILNNNRSLSASRNNSFCARPSSGGINHGAHAKRIAQLLLSPTGSSLHSSNDCSMCPPRRESTISETVCDSLLELCLFSFFSLLSNHINFITILNSTDIFSPLQFLLSFFLPIHFSWDSLFEFDIELSWCCCFTVQSSTESIDF